MSPKSISKAPWNRELFKQYAESKLALPPEPGKHIDRFYPEPDRVLVASFVLPLEMCLPTNRRDSIHWTKRHEARNKLYDMVFTQYGMRHRTDPLAGRPQVFVTRFSPRRTDRGASYEKMPVDCLQPFRRVRIKKSGKIRETKGIGLIRNDTETAIDLRVWWERGPGFIYMRVFSG